MQSSRRDARKPSAGESISLEAGHGNLPDTDGDMPASSNWTQGSTIAERRRRASAANRSGELAPERTSTEPNMAENRLSIVLPRDSHDLSLSPRNITRDSFVTNMLLSLDQFSIGQSDSRYSLDQFGTSSQHLYDASSSWASAVGQATAKDRSDYCGRGNDTDSIDTTRISDQMTRSRRSYSNTIANKGFEKSQQDSQKPRSRGGRGSRNSSVTSFDTPYLQNNLLSRSQDLNRSASFDHHQGQEKAQQQPSPLHLQQMQQRQQSQSPHQWHQQTSPLSPFQIEFPNSFPTDEFDAAPTPTVHGGPRRAPSTPSMSHERNKHAVERKRSGSSRSLKSSAGRKAPTGQESVPAVPSIPSFDTEAAPSPRVGYEKSKDDILGSSPSSTAVAVPRERSGFFRKIFGGSSKNNDAEQVTNYRVVPAPAAQNERSGSKGPDKPNTPHGSSAPPSRDGSSRQGSQTLQKKPSSFFRRRKKSVADECPAPEEAPPVPPIDPAIEKERSISVATASSSNDLRKTLHQQYQSQPAAPSTPIKQASPSATATHTTPRANRSIDGLGEYKREFSPDYEPSPNARIRAVQPEDTSNGANISPSTLQPSRANRAKTDSFLNLDAASDEDEPSWKGARGQGKEEQLRSSRDLNNTSKQHDDPKTKKQSHAKLNRLKTDVSNSKSSLALPQDREGSPATESTMTDYKSVASHPPSVHNNASAEPSPQTRKTSKSKRGQPIDEPEFVLGEPTQDDESKAQQIFEGNEDFISKQRAAAWMGEEGPVRKRTLQAYMQLYDFTDCSIVHSLRQICGRLVLRAETQQVDRILVAFSNRWRECNPNHGFRATDVIHTICYSIMLLNTDLHLADIEQKMTRSQFVKNTLSTITSALLDVEPDAFDRKLNSASDKSGLAAPGGSSLEPQTDKKSFRNSFRPPPRADSSSFGADGTADCGPLVKSPFNGSMKQWQEQVELVLKAIYTSIRDQRLPLFGAEPEKTLSTAASQNSLAVSGTVRRSPSVLSRAPSEGQLSARGRINESGRNTSSRWSSKSRSRPGIGRAGFSSSRTSFDDGNSAWSPALSSATWSRQSLGRTQTSVSQDSFGSAMPKGDYQQSIGFANALSQAIIRDEDANGNENAPSILSMDMTTTALLEDESLELAGPPWAKEGMVIHKHHLDGVDKKAKERNWSEVFAVITKGQLSLFSFVASKSQRHKVSQRGNGPVGGGNWQDNATTVGTFSLRQTLASALPPPGYSRTRPYVWALSLPTGAVHLFQVGTPDIIKEFVTTVNYWSARLSTHPLMGGVSNIEYGWSDAIVSNALVAAVNDTGSASPSRSSRPGSSAHVRRSSVASSFRSASFDQGIAALTNTSSRGKLPGDRINIADWAPPTQSMRPSTMPEAEQLGSLQAYVKSIGDELQTHNQLRSPMLLAFTPRGSNAAKAMANWERKSAYLLREIVKFRTYVDCLAAAGHRKREIYEERDLARRAARGELSDEELEPNEDEDGDVTLKP